MLYFLLCVPKCCVKFFIRYNLTKEEISGSFIFKFRIAFMCMSLFVIVLKYLPQFVMILPVLFYYCLNFLRYSIDFLMLLFLSLCMPSVQVCIYDISMSDAGVLISVQLISFDIATES